MEDTKMIGTGTFLRRNLESWVCSAWSRDSFGRTQQQPPLTKGKLSGSCSWALPCSAPRDKRQCVETEAVKVQTGETSAHEDRSALVSVTLRCVVVSSPGGSKVLAIYEAMRSGQISWGPWSEQKVVLETYWGLFQHALYCGSMIF